MSAGGVSEEKTSGEWEAVHCIFPKDQYTVTGDLRPDFLVTQTGNNYTVGVEVTSFYFHMGSARLKKDSRYLQDVLDGNPHEKDQMIMRKETLIFPERLDENGKEVELKVVAYNHLPFPEFIQLLGQEIEKKSKKYLNYTGPASRLHLIVVDEENYFSGSTIEQVSTCLIRDDGFNEILQHSVFFEIYFLTNVNMQKCYILLKQALFLSRQRLTAQFFYHKLMPEVSPSQFVIVFIDIMVRLGYSLMKSFREGENVYFVHQNLMIRINNEGIKETFYQDSPKFDFLLPLSTLMEGTQNQLPIEVFEDFLAFQRENAAYLHDVIHFLPEVNAPQVTFDNTL